MRLLWSPDEEPVVDIAQGVRHKRLCLIVPPLPVYNELVLVVPAECIGHLMIADEREQKYDKLYVF